MRKFTKDHEWIEVNGTTGTVGISDYAQGQLGDVVYAECPAIGKAVAQGAEAGVVESVKAASEIYAPVSGTVSEANDALSGDPSLINSDPFGKGWFFKLTISNPAELDGLMDEAAYQNYIKGI